MYESRPDCALPAVRVISDRNRQLEKEMSRGPFSLDAVQQLYNNLASKGAIKSEG
jgi:hypothetical protein